MNKKMLLSAIGTIIVLSTSNAFADELAKETLSKENAYLDIQKNNLETQSNLFAREGGSRNKGRRGANTESSSDNLVAREASEGPRGGDNERPGDRQRRGGRMSADDAGQFILAREASEGPRGNDNNNHRQRRGGRMSADDAGQFILAREASEGPRGNDNNNHRQRRGGRNA